MCGIAGLMMVGSRSPAPERLARLADALSHRGPDLTSTLVRGNVGLVHTRLSIVDVVNGGQPIFDADDRALIANGEIYNDLDLRATSLSEVKYVTGSDCETILALYGKHGPDCVKYLRGMYAFSIHDVSKGLMVISRDPFGIKPLYYVETDEYFAFASEPQSLIASNLAQAVLRPGVPEELLQLQFTTGRPTIFIGINRVLPGETLIIQGGRVIERRIQEALPTARRINTGKTAALAQLGRAIENSVEVHKRSDVPFGLFLSSGVDSAVLLACLRRETANPLIAYTASFPGCRLTDEYPQAHRVATTVGVQHINVQITEDDFWRHLPRIAASVDDPTADYAIVPTYLLAREAAKDVKVVLCGEGGDEIFGGYSRYRRQSRPWWLAGRVRRRTGPFSGKDILRQDTEDWRQGIVDATIATSLSTRSRLQVAQALDCAESLPNALLTKLDRCLMAHGLEGRTPFLDPVVAELGFLLPQRLKLGRGRGKYLMRLWLEKHLPEAKPFARKKGFTVPVGEWILSKGELLGELLATDPAIQAVCKPNSTQRLFVSAKKSDQDAAWRLLFYALWHRRHIRGLEPVGDVFECLTSNEVAKPPRLVSPVQARGEFAPAAEPLAVLSL